MATNTFFQNFLGGFSRELQSQNDNDRELRQKEELAKFNKDEDYRRMVMQNTLISQREQALSDHNNQLKRQNASSEAADEAAATESKRKAIFGDIRGATTQYSSLNIGNQVNQAMNPSGSGAAPLPLPSPSANPTTVALGSDQNVPAGSGAPVQGNNPSGNASQAQTTGATTLPSGQPDNAVAQYAPPPNTASSPQVISPNNLGHTSNESASVQNSGMNNSSTSNGASSSQAPKTLPNSPVPNANSMNIAGTQYGNNSFDWLASDAGSAQMSKLKGQLTRLGMDVSNDDNVKYFATAPTPESVLTPAEQNRYMDLIDKESGLKQFMDNSPNVKAWRVAHNLTTDGEPLPDSALPKPEAVLWDKTLMRPYGKLDDLNKFYIAQSEKINDTKSSQYQDITAPRQQALGRLEELNQQSRINAFVTNGPGTDSKVFLDRLNASAGIEAKTAAYDDLAYHMLGVEKRDIFSNTKGRVTNQEAQQFFKALPDLINSEDGRRSIIAFMTGQATRELEVANLKSRYINDNNGLYNTDHASQLEQAYRQANPIFASGAFDTKNPMSMFNLKAMSSDNWINMNAGRPLNPNDSLQSALNFGNNGASTGASGGTTAISNPDVTNKANSVLSKFGL